MAVLKQSDINALKKVENGGHKLVSIINQINDCLSAIDGSASTVTPLLATFDADCILTINYDGADIIKEDLSIILDKLEVPAPVLTFDKEKCTLTLAYGEEEDQLLDLTPILEKLRDPDTGKYSFDAVQLPKIYESDEITQEFGVLAFDKAGCIAKAKGIEINEDNKIVTDGVVITDFIDIKPIPESDIQAYLGVDKANCVVPYTPEKSICDDDKDTCIILDDGTDPDHIRFETDGVKRMEIGETGHVGINVDDNTPMLYIKEDGPRPTVVLEQAAVGNTGPDVAFSKHPGDIGAQLRYNTQDEHLVLIADSTHTGLGGLGYAANAPATHFIALDGTTGDVQLSDYPNTRDDCAQTPTSAATTPVNVLSTDATGHILSCPVSTLVQTEGYEVWGANPQDLTAPFSPNDIDNERYFKPWANKNVNEVRLTAGRYHITATWTGDMLGNDSRSAAEHALFVDGTQVPGTAFRTYHRENPVGDQSGTTTLYWESAANFRIQLNSRRIHGSGTIRNIPEGTKLTIIRIGDL